MTEGAKKGGERMREQKGRVKRDAGGERKGGTVEENDKEGKKEKGNGGKKRRKEGKNGSERGQRISKMAKMGAEGGKQGVPFSGTFMEAPLSLQIALLMQKTWPAWHRTAGINWSECGRLPKLALGKQWEALPSGLARSGSSLPESSASLGQQELGLPQPSATLKPRPMWTS